MTWRPTPAGVTLRAQIDARWPGRDHASDGVIADANHAPTSDHQADADGWVHALDVDADLDPGDPGAMRRLADQLAEYCRTRQPGSERIKNLVYDDQVCSGTYPATFWTWRGSGYGHRHHLHVSFTDAAERDGSPFPLPIFREDEDMPLTNSDAATVWARPVREFIDENGNGERDVRTVADLLAATHRAAVTAARQTATPPAGSVDLDALVDRLADAVADRIAERMQA